MFLLIYSLEPLQDQRKRFNIINFRLYFCVKSHFIEGDVDVDNLDGRFFSGEENLEFKTLV